MELGDRTEMCKKGMEKQDEEGQAVLQRKPYRLTCSLQSICWELTPLQFVQEISAYLLDAEDSCLFRVWCLSHFVSKPSNYVTEPSHFPFLFTRTTDHERLNYRDRHCFLTFKKLPLILDPL